MSHFGFWLKVGKVSVVTLVSSYHQQTLLRKELLLCSRHCAKYFAYTSSCNPVAALRCSFACMY